MAQMMASHTQDSTSEICNRLCDTGMAFSKYFYFPQKTNVQTMPHTHLPLLLKCDVNSTSKKDITAWVLSCSFNSDLGLKCNRTLLEKLTVTQLVKKFDTFMESKEPIIISEPDESNWQPLRSITSFWECNSISPFKIHYNIINLLTHEFCKWVPSGFQIKILYAFLICPTHTLSHTSWTDHPYGTWWRVQIMKYLIMQFSSASHYFFSLR
jgi:hypothetical protein